MIEAQYVHTNLIANDWRRLARFYQDVLGCTPVPPERDYTDASLGRATGIENAALQGIHLRLPSGGEQGPTLEIFQYRDNLPDVPRAPNRPGFGHLAFSVADVAQARTAVLEAGGQPVGDVVTLSTSDDRQVTWCYVTDPEGNILEFQKWS